MNKMKSRRRRLFGSTRPEQRSLFNIADGLIPVGTASGKAISESTSMTHSVVWSAVSLIADGISGLAPEAYVSSPDNPDQQVKVDLPPWVRSPHTDMRRFDVFHQLIVSLLLWGNAYALIVRRPSDGTITGLYPLDPARVTAEWAPQPGYRRYRIDSGPWLSSADIFHVQGPTLPGESTGLSVIRQARESIGLGLTLEEYGARYFGQGSQAKIVIEMPSQVDDFEAARIIKQYERFHKGRNNWHRPAIMSGGAKIHNVSIPPEDAQFLESRQFQEIDIARWFRVPPHRVGIIGVQTSWGSGLAEENQAMLQHTFRPWILRIEDALTAYAPGGDGRGTKIRLNTNELSRGSFASQVDAWSKAVNGRIATPNEARKALGLNPVDGGDELAAVPAAPAPGKQADDSDKQADASEKEADRKRKQDEAKKL